MSLGDKKDIHISGGFCLLITWFLLVNGWQLMADILCAAAIHELGHWLVLRLLGAQILGVQIGVLGIVMKTDCHKLSYGRELAAVLAGPGANFLSAAVTSVLTSGNESEIGAHLVLAAFNLLPIRPLDGGSALYLCIAWLFGPAAGETAARWAGIAASMALSVGILVLMLYTGGSLWLLPAAIGLLMAGFKRFE